ncbi:hypothetical protein SDRG_09235 [Saprolegnia diclina VS20]|uniref:Uncharacterized protein n=1 Tax=Saprolegnia diclina (strain VS20) TaxID=1156394 RepID=T0RSR2_SAPDV|nr:hypothetical protein SDRG_09235 [Saprolegnia diclina VS20]EQC33252.1 hypothetical protein SDRG_09235 [Saprolegnia diclina VS20]|eukprot:XP_008613375.1 hypothetical protein SDRG_09235 [Saprolegnia diclina VS20]
MGRNILMPNLARWMTLFKIARNSIHLIRLAPRDRRSAMSKTSPLEEVKQSTQNMLLAGAIGGSVGATWGVCLATVRSQPLGFYAASVGANLALASASYMTVFEILKRNNGGSTDNISTYVLPGTITGGALLGLAGLGTPMRAVQGSIAGSVVGLGAYFADKKFQEWRLAKSIERYQAKHGIDAHETILLNGRVETAYTPVADRHKFDLPDLIPSFVRISEDEVQARIEARLAELREAAKTAP